MREYIRASMVQVLADNELTYEVCSLYAHIFNTEWEESWTLESAKEKLFGKKALSIPSMFVGWKNGQKLSAFLIAGVSKIDNSIVDFEMPPCCCDEKTVEEVKRQLRYFLPNKDDPKIMIIREMGISRKDSVGVALVAEMLAVMLKDGAKAGSDFACCWTSITGSLYGILKAYDVRDVYRFRSETGLMLLGDYQTEVAMRMESPMTRRMIIDRLKCHGLR